MMSQNILALFCLLVLMQIDKITCSQVSCTYANSTCSDCGELCLQGQLFPLLPSLCHPASQMLTYLEDETHPNREPPSVQLPESFTVPADLLPPFNSTRDGFTITMYFKETNPQSNTMRLLSVEGGGKTLVLSFTSNLVRLDLNNNLTLTQVVEDEGWKAIALTWNTTTVSLSNGSSSSSISVTSEDVTTNFAAVIIGSNSHTVIVQDIIVYDNALQDFNLPSMATFLPQCYCYPNQTCSEEERYSATSAMASDFAVDESLATAWRSGYNDTPVRFVVGLRANITLSKIFVKFQQPSSYENVILQFFSSNHSEWVDLQYYAENCEASFVMEQNTPLTDSKGVNCLPSNNNLLTFFIGGSQRPSLTLADESYFTTNQIRFIMQGFTTSTSYSIQDIEICPDFCFDLAPNCTCSSASVSPTAAPMLTILPTITSTVPAEEGSGFSTFSPAEVSSREATSAEEGSGFFTFSPAEVSSREATSTSQASMLSPLPMQETKSVPTSASSMVPSPSPTSTVEIMATTMRREDTSTAQTHAVGSLATEIVSMLIAPTPTISEDIQSPTTFEMATSMEINTAETIALERRSTIPSTTATQLVIPESTTPIGSTPAADEGSGFSTFSPAEMRTVASGLSSTIEEFRTSFPKPTSTAILVSTTLSSAVTSSSLSSTEFIIATTAGPTISSTSSPAPSSTPFTEGSGIEASTTTSSENSLLVDISPSSIATHIQLTTSLERTDAAGSLLTETASVLIAPTPTISEDNQSPTFEVVTSIDAAATTPAILVSATLPSAASSSLSSTESIIATTTGPTVPSTSSPVPTSTSRPMFTEGSGIEPSSSRDERSLLVDISPSSIGSLATSISSPVVASSPIPQLESSEVIEVTLTSFSGSTSALVSERTVSSLNLFSEGSGDGVLPSLTIQPTQSPFLSSIEGSLTPQPSSTSALVGVGLSEVMSAPTSSSTTSEVVRQSSEAFQFTAVDSSTPSISPSSSQPSPVSTVFEGSFASSQTTQTALSSTQLLPSPSPTEGSGVDMFTSQPEETFLSPSLSFFIEPTPSSLIEGSGDSITSLIEMAFTLTSEFRSTLVTTARATTSASSTDFTVSLTGDTLIVPTSAGIAMSSEVIEPTFPSSISIAPSVSDGSGDDFFTSTQSVSPTVVTEPTISSEASVASSSTGNELFTPEATPTSMLAIEPASSSSVGFAPSSTEGSGDGFLTVPIIGATSVAIEPTSAFSVASITEGSGDFITLTLSMPILETTPTSTAISLSSSVGFGPSSTGNNLITPTQSVPILEATPTSIEPTFSSSVGFGPSSTEGSGDGLFTQSVPMEVTSTSIIAIEATVSSGVASFTEGSGDDFITPTPSLPILEQTAIEPSFSSSVAFAPSSTEGSGDGLFTQSLPILVPTSTSTAAIEPSFSSSVAFAPPSSTEGSGDGLITESVLILEPTSTFTVAIEPSFSSSVAFAPPSSTEGSGDGLITESVLILEPTSTFTVTIEQSFSSSVAFGPSSTEGSGDGFFTQSVLILEPTSTFMIASFSSSVAFAPPSSTEGSGNGFFTQSAPVLEPTSTFAVAIEPSFSSSVASFTEGSGEDFITPIQVAPTSTVGIQATFSSSIASFTEGSGDFITPLQVAPTSTVDIQATFSSSVTEGSGDDFITPIQVAPTSTVGVQATFSSSVTEGSGDDFVTPTLSILEVTPTAIEPTFSSSVASFTEGSGDDFFTPTESVPSFETTFTVAIEPTISPSAGFPSVTEGGSGDDIFTPAQSVQATLTFTIEPTVSPSVTEGSGGDFFTQSLESSPVAIESTSVAVVPSFTEGSGDFFFSSADVGSLLFTIAPTPTVVLPTSILRTESLGFSTPIEIRPTSTQVFLTTTVDFAGSGASLGPSLIAVPTVSASPLPSPFVSGSGSGSGSGDFSLNPDFMSTTIMTSSLLPTPSASSLFIATSDIVTSMESIAQFTTSILPSPSPSPFVCDLQNVSESESSLSVRVAALGSSFTNQPVRRIGMLNYFTSLALYGGVSQSPGLIQVSLGNLTRSSTVSAELTNTTLFNITAAALSNDQVFYDHPYTTVALQVSQQSLTNDVEIEGLILLVLLESGAQSNHTFTCTPRPSGICREPIEIPNSWFNTSRNISVQVFADVENNGIMVGELTLMAKHPQFLPNTTYLNLPRRSVQTEEELELAIYASYSKLLLSFSLDCILSGPATIKDASAQFEWSLLSDFFNDSKKQIAVTGFRNYNKGNVSDTGMQPDHLFNLTLSIRNDSISSNVQVKCDAVMLTLTTGIALEPLRPIDIIDRSGQCQQCSIVISQPKPVKIFASAQQSELLNIANLTGNTSEVPLDITLFQSDGSLSSVTANCSSQDSSVIQVGEDCSGVYFTGDESSGSDGVDIMITYENLSSSIPFKVWSLSGEVNILLEDAELNLIATDCSDVIYQQTPFSIVANISTSSRSTQRQVILTNYLASNVTSSNKSIANVFGSYILGFSEGVVNISLFSSTSAQVTVTNDPVCLFSLNVFVFSDIEIQVVQYSDAGLLQNVSISLLQNFNYVDSVVHLLAMATYSDGFTTDVSDNVTFVRATTTETEEIEGSSYILRDVQDANITAMWNCTMILGEEIVDPINSIPELQITPSSGELTAENDVAAVIGVPSTLQLEFKLLYPDRFAVSIMDHSRFTISFDPNGTLHFEDGVIVVTSGGNASGVEITACYEVDVCDSILINITRVVEFNLTAYEPNMGYAISTLSQISSSGVFQAAQVMATAHFNDGTSENISPMVIVSVLDNNSMIDINTTRLADDKIIQVEAIHVPSLQVTFQGILQCENNSSLRSESLTVLVTNNSLGVESIGEVVVSKSNTDNQLYVDCAVRLEDQTYLDHTFEEGNPMYPNLIYFSTNDMEFIYLNDSSSGIILVRRNSLDLVTITAHSNDINDTNSTTFYSNLLPGTADIDLGSNRPGAKPLDDVSQNDTFTVPVILNSVDTAIGVYELSVQYEPASALTLNDVIQGDSWKNGSLISIEQDGVITLSGVLVTGAQGPHIELAVLTFRACESCSEMVNFSVDIEFFSEANVSVSDINPSISSASEVKMAILPRSNRKRRHVTSDELVFLRPKRQVSPRMLDMRDVYVLQVYLAAAVYNFNTPQGMEVRSFHGQIDNASANKIISIEMSSLGVNYNVTDVFYRYFLDSGSDECVQEISGLLRNIDGGRSVNSEFVHVLLQFSSDNSSFQADFNNTNFSNANVLDSNAGILEASLVERNDTAMFQVRSNVFKTEEFEVSIITVVNIGGQTSSNLVDLVGGLYSDVMVVSNIPDENECIESTTKPLTTTEPLTTQLPTIEMTTQPPTTEMTTQPPTTEMTTQPPTTEMTTEMTTQPPTTEMNTVPLTTEMTTQPPTTEMTTGPLTTEMTTQPPTTEMTTPSTTEMTTEPLTTEMTTQPPTTEMSTPPPTTGMTTQPLTTGMTTQPPTTEMSTPPPTTGMTTQPPTSGMSTPPPTTGTTQPPTSGMSTPPPITGTTQPPTSGMSTPPPTTGMTTQPPTTAPPPINEMTTQPSTIETTTEITLTEQPGGSSIVQALFPVMAVVAIVLVIVIVVILVIWGKKRSKKKKGIYRPNNVHTPSRTANSDFWFSEEEKIEMSPIDIVPLEENMYVVEESSMDIVPNHRIYHSERTDSTIFSNIHLAPSKQASNHTKHSHPTFTDVPIEPAPPPYTSATTITAKTEATASSYEMEEDDIAFDLKFDDGQVQPYLSLGLTPLSQLSPPDPTPQSSASGADSCFFPSMPPPVTPISSVFNMNTGSTGSGTGIPVDSPFQLGSGMVMPEGNPVGEPSTNARRGNRRSKHEVSSHSQGYAMKLEPLMEQSCSLDDSVRDTVPKTIVINGLDSSSSSGEDPTYALLGADKKLPAHLCRKTGKRRKSGIRRKMDEDLLGDKESTIIGNRGLQDAFDFPVKLSREDSPRQEGRRLRQQIREQELARQKEKLRLKRIEEERARLMRQEQRAAQIAQDYGSTRQRENEQTSSSGLVLEQAMRFEAQAQLLQDVPPATSSPSRNANRQAELKPIVNTSNQFSVL